MLNRRLLRVKVLQSLYAYMQSSDVDANKAERELFLSIDRIYDLYLHLLILPTELAQHAALKQEDSQKKNFASEIDKQSTNNFIENKFIHVLNEDQNLQKLLEHRSISWSDNQELISKAFKKIKESSAYHEYVLKESPSFEDDVNFLLFICKNILCKFELIEQSFHEKSIYWSEEEFDYACMMVRNSMKRTLEDGKQRFTVTPLFKDDEDDRKFVRELFHKTIEHSQESEEIIADKAKNWELERIAVLDIIMMKMAITELTEFRSIPVKVTLNEYIEISKFFSSPKSKTFINGVLDKIIPALKKEKRIVKTGRGLME